MYGKTPSPVGKSPTPTPKRRGSKSKESFYDFANRASPMDHVASRRVPMEPTPKSMTVTPFHSARSSTTPKKKRCPNGSRKNKKSVCVKRGSRCAVGTRKNRKTRVCEPKKN